MDSGPGVRREDGGRGGQGSGLPSRSSCPYARRRRLPGFRASRQVSKLLVQRCRTGAQQGLFHALARGRMASQWSRNSAWMLRFQPGRCQACRGRPSLWRVRTSLDPLEVLGSGQARDRHAAHQARGADLRRRRSEALEEGREVADGAESVAIVIHDGEGREADKTG